MKKSMINKYCLLALLISFGSMYNVTFAQDDAAGQTVIRLQYHNENNGKQYLLLESQWKKNKVFTPQKNKKYQLYLDSAGPSTRIADLVTNGEGKAKAIIPPALKNAWDAADQHTFIVKEGEEELLSDMVISKSKMIIDTTNEDGVKSITASVFKLENKEWVPMPDVEMKVGIRRLGGLLSGGEEETYTTDSTGTVTVEFKKDSLPGDAKGNIILMARVDDNDQLGNLTVEKSVRWGKAQQVSTNFFNQRTLWSTRFKTPYWLLFMAYSIVIAVWGTLFYLIAQLLKIKKLGQAK